MHQTPIRRKPCSDAGALKVKGSLEVSQMEQGTIRKFQYLVIDPRWADPIKDRIRHMNQLRAVNEVVNALNPSQSTSRPEGSQRPPLHVVNGMSTPSSSTVTTMARENVPISPNTNSSNASLSPISPGRPGGSTIRWTAGLAVHSEHEDEEETILQIEKDLPEPPILRPKKPITPSLATLEKAVAARIYFENLYFPLLRQTPAREKRRLAMEQEMMSMQLTEAEKNYLRERWRQNETDYLRERRRKVDVSAFVKLKTIGHGAFLPLNTAKGKSLIEL